MNSKNIIVSGIVGGVSALIVSGVVNGLMQGVEAGDQSLDGLEVSTERVLQVEKEESLVISAVENAVPSVVSVVIEKDVPKLETYYEEFGGPFGFVVPRYRENGTERREVGGGSGFVVSEDGYIVTNKHVVSDESANYVVLTNDGEKHEAKVVAIDPLNDVAVLKIEAEGLEYLNFSDSDELKLGQTVIAIGNPLLEFNNSVSLGIVSGLSRSIVAGDGMGRSEQLEGVIQTDAAINPGNSGGPLLNSSGEVIGVNVAVAADGQNIGFALPANLVAKAVESVKENGKIVRPYIGVRYVPVTPVLKEANKLSVDYGVLVLRGEKVEDLAVVPGSPADKAGIVENDIILEVDGVKLEEGKSMARLIAEKSIGDKVKLKILSKGEEKEVEVSLDAMPE